MSFYKIAFGEIGFWGLCWYVCYFLKDKICMKLKKEVALKFEIGKFYEHSSGGMMHVIGGLQTTLYGGCLVAESSYSGSLRPIGQDEDATINWVEISKEKWMQNFS